MVHGLRDIENVAMIIVRAARQDELNGSSKVYQAGRLNSISA